MFLLPYNLRAALIVSMIGMIACLSLVLLTGLVGQVSLFQFGLAGVAGVISPSSPPATASDGHGHRCSASSAQSSWGWSSHCLPCGSAACNWLSSPWPQPPR